MDMPSLLMLKPLGTMGILSTIKNMAMAATGGEMAAFTKAGGIKVSNTDLGHITVQKMDLSQSKAFGRMESVSSGLKKPWWRQSKRVYIRKI